MLIETICGWCWREKNVLWHLCTLGNDFTNILYLRAGLLEEVTGQYLTIFSAFLFHVTLTICWYNCLEWSIKWRYIIKELFLSSDKNIQSCAVAISFQYLNFPFSEFKSLRKKIRKRRSGQFDIRFDHFIFVKTLSHIPWIKVIQSQLVLASTGKLENT